MWAEDYRSPCFSAAAVDGLVCGWLQRFWGYPGVCLHSKEAGFGAAAEDYRSPCFSSALVDGYAGGWLQRFWGHPEFVCTLFNLLNKLW